jgi:hypothetical protein
MHDIKTSCAISAEKCCANSVASALGTVLGFSAREVNTLDGDQEASVVHRHQEI